MELIDVFNSMFKDRSKWKNLTNEDKEKFFFIINRYMSKKFPEKSKLLNDKLINKVSAMDTWYLFTNDMNYPKWFWSKSSKSNKKEKEVSISVDEINKVCLELELKIEDVYYLLNNYPEIISEEVSFYRNGSKQNK